MAVNKAECPDFLNDYIFYLRIVRGRAETTVNEYFLNIRLFLRYILMTKQNLNQPLESVKIKDFPAELLKEITLRDVYDFEYFLAEERGNKPAARARKTAALKSFFHYLHKRANLIDHNPADDVEMPSVKRALPKFLTLEESLRLLSSDSFENPERDFCIVTLFLNCGMRLNELVSINLDDIDFEERKLLLKGKGSKQRIIYINDACISAIKTYLNSRKNPPEEPNALFLSRKKRRISRRRVEQIIEKLLDETGLGNRGISPHKLRHTAATLMYQHGNVDTLVIKEVLGHASIATTEIYTHLSDDLKQSAAENIPIAKMKRSPAQKKKEESKEED
ncbi:MAG: tyrosine-type recombinase/integrase [Oscillospiraceae bacterium]|nr:tyrosine-type recombinase/integrase [Oscillospiraceae bacterium]